jgi:hypothetical protein
MRVRSGDNGRMPVRDQMPKLITASSFANPDAAYVALVDARRNLSDAEAATLDTRLVLILANHIGDLDVLAKETS